MSVKTTMRRGVEASKRRGVETLSEELSSDDRGVDGDPSGDEAGLFELTVEL